MRQVEHAAAEGFREIVFLGQTVNAYRDPEAGVDFRGAAPARETAWSASRGSIHVAPSLGHDGRRHPGDG